MNQPKWFFHPISLLVFSIVALTACLSLYIYWYVEVSTAIQALSTRFNIDPMQFTRVRTWVVIVTVSILFAVILLGINMIFVFNQKTSQLYRMQNNFINNFTHELKTPVTSLKLYLQTFMLHDFTEEEKQKYLRFMLKDVDRLSDNINRILNLAKIEADSYKGQFVRTNVVDTVRRFLRNNGHLFHDCEINVHAPGGRAIFVDINFPLFEMLLMNLLTNATQYNTSDVPTVDITFTEKKGKVAIEFEDNGIGMDKKYRKKVFRKFYQAPHPETVLAKGSGLGLYLVRMIAREHKGKVTAHSEGPGMGTTITVVMKSHSAEEREDAHGSDTGSGGGEGSGVPGGEGVHHA
ncbi:MAG: sensor histidine kinase [Desulfatibacillaceae bacterium]